MEKCEKCGMPMEEGECCSCRPSRCYHCCKCEDGCSCNCTNRELREIEEEKEKKE
ncbi:MAG: hypothetical protein OEV37_01515 [Candidatus Berkelbacteria bacterium]|nr:hypothetical protein [Candidatus Berkelbacteria bacterium]